MAQGAILKALPVEQSPAKLNHDVPMQTQAANTSTHRQTHTHEDTNTYTRTHAHMHTNTKSHARRHRQRRRHAHTHTYAQTHIHTTTNTYTQTHIHTYTHTQKIGLFPLSVIFPQTDKHSSAPHAGPNSSHVHDILHASPTPLLHHGPPILQNGNYLCAHNPPATYMQVWPLKSIHLHLVSL